MLNLYFGDLDGALLSGNGYFDRQIDESCIETDFGRRVIKEIDGGLGVINGVSQHQSAAVEEITASLEQINASMQSLNELSKRI